MLYLNIFKNMYLKICNINHNVKEKSYQFLRLRLQSIALVDL